MTAFNREPERLADEFRFFARMCTGRSPLYAALAARVAGTPALLALASGAAPGQPPVNLLFGAVHDLLLAGAAHPLAGFYPSVGGAEAPEEAFPAFADFCRRHRAEILVRVRTRRVQTNEVGRSGILLPALAEAAREAGPRPSYLIEVGASAGLNLLHDRYRYQYSDGQRCGPESPALVRVEVRGPRRVPVPAQPPGWSDRVGVDVAPGDVTDDGAMRWIEALIWPDQVERLELLRAAVAVARRDPPRILAGDAMVRVPELVHGIPPGQPVCLVHSHALYQATPAWRRDFRVRLDELGRARPLLEVSLEWLGKAPGPRLRLNRYEGGSRRSRLLADADHHGAWIAWRG